MECEPVDPLVPCLASAARQGCPERSLGIGRRHLSAMTQWAVWLALLCLLSGHVLANPTVPQGGNGSFAQTGGMPPAITGWTIKLSGVTKGSTATPNGWSVTYNGSQFTVTAPNSNTYAPIATGYQVAYGYMGSVTMTATFDVVSGTGGQLTNFTVTPTSTPGGQNVTGTLTLSSAAPTGGLPVTLSCDTAKAAYAVGVSAPGQDLNSNSVIITVPAGQTSTTFTLATSTVDHNTTLNFAATSSPTTLHANLTLTAANLRVTNILMPSTIQLQWDGTAIGSFQIVRQPLPNGTGVLLATVPNTTHTYSDTTPFVNGTT